MPRTLVVYATTEGHTAKIARRIAEVGRALGFSVDVARVDGAGSELGLEGYDAAILGASLHVGRFQTELLEFARAHAVWLDSRPSAFFAVSLGAASRDPAERADVDRRIAHFLQQIGWTPVRIQSFAGALRYTRYGRLKRALLRWIAAREGGPTDASHDHELTDWNAVTRFAQQFFRELSERPLPGREPAPRRAAAGP